MTPVTEAGKRCCKAWATTRSDVSSRFDFTGPCRNPAKYRVGSTVPNKAPPDDEVCGVHARAYLMDNGDSVRKPWTIQRLELR